MSVDREYRTRIKGNGNADLKQSAPVPEDAAATNKSQVDRTDGVSAELPSLPSGFDVHLTSREGVAQPSIDLKIPQQIAQPLPVGSPSPDGGPPQFFAQTAGAFEKGSAPFEPDFGASEPPPKLPQERTAATPANQSVIESQALAELMNRTRHHALPMQQRSAAGQDTFELLSLLRQLRESFSEYVHACVTREELRDELTSLRLLIESKK